MGEGADAGARPGPAREGGVPDPKLTRPRAVSTASVLWMVLGGLLIGAVRYGGTYALVLGLGLVVSGIFLRWGSNVARIVATVLGSITMIGILPAVLVVPALVLQFGRESNAWFDSFSRRESALPRITGGES